MGLARYTTMATAICQKCARAGFSHHHLDHGGRL